MQSLGRLQQLSFYFNIYNTFSIFTKTEAKGDSAEATKSGCKASLWPVTEVNYRAEKKICLW